MFPSKIVLCSHVPTLFPYLFPSNLYSFVPLFPKNRLMFPCSPQYFVNVPLFPTVPLFPKPPGRPSYICTRIAGNNGIISKLRHLTLLQMKQIYYSLIYPYISYAVLEWGSAYKTHIDKIQTKQNHSARRIFFATTYGEHSERALPLLNFLDAVWYIMFIRFQILKFTYLSHEGLLPKLFSGNQLFSICQ